MSVLLAETEASRDVRASLPPRRAPLPGTSGARNKPIKLGWLIALSD
jgi:hypothetical protein